MSCSNTFPFGKKKKKESLRQYEVIKKKKNHCAVYFIMPLKELLFFFCFLFIYIAHLICDSDNAPTDNRELTVKNLFLNDSFKSSRTFLMTNPPNYHFHQQTANTYSGHH